MIKTVYVKLFHKNKQTKKPLPNRNWVFSIHSLRSFNEIFLTCAHCFIYSFLVTLGLHFCTWAFSSCSKWGLLFILVCFSLWLLIVVTSLVAEHRLLGAWALVLAAYELSCGTWSLGHRLSSCSTWTLLHCMYNLPGPGIEPVSPALSGGFSSTVQPRKS